MAEPTCRRCGRCCAVKVIVEDKVIYTGEACRYFDPETRLYLVILAGATLRIPNSFFVALSGGRNVIATTTMLLILPALGATRATIRTIMAKPGWSSRELKAVRGMLRALSNPRSRRD